MLRAVLNGLTVLLLLAFTAVLAVMVVIPTVTGWLPLSVLSGSMEPTIPTGSQVVVSRAERPEQWRTLKAGDVITFLPRPNDATLVTHRIVRVQVDAEGQRTFITKGDANPSEDPPVREHQVRGKVRYHVPYAGRVALLMNNKQKPVAILAVVAGLFLYAGWQVFGALRKRSGTGRALPGKTGLTRPEGAAARPSMPAAEPPRRAVSPSTVTRATPSVNGQQPRPADAQPPR